jgi:hypothetical protein
MVTLLDPTADADNYSVTDINFDNKATAVLYSKNFHKTKVQTETSAAAACI